MATSHHVAWWNVENLFDEEDAPLERRPDKVRRAIGKDTVGWTPALRDEEVAQLASVVAQLNSGRGPDLLGVCARSSTHWPSAPVQGPSTGGRR